MKHAKEIITSSLKELKFILPMFLLGVLFSVLVEFYVSDQFITSLLGKHLLIAIPAAALIGIIIPIPRYATYPIAFTLLTKGASFGIIFALISAEVLTGTVVREALEVKYFGFKFSILRILISVIFIIAGAFLFEVLL